MNDGRKCGILGQRVLFLGREDQKSSVLTPLMLKQLRLSHIMKEESFNMKVLPEGIF